MERLLALAALAAVLGALVVGGRLMAARRLRGLRSRGAGPLWDALETRPDGRPAVVAFSTPSCAACHTAQRPALTALEERTQSRLRIVQIDAAERPQVARAFGIMTVPATVVLDARGAVLAANHGFATTETLAEQVGVLSAAASR